MNAIEIPSGNQPIDSPPARLTNRADTRDYEDTDRRRKIAAFLQLSKKRFKTAEAASFRYRREMRKDQRFAAGSGYQWETEDRAAREADMRPCLEINRIPQFIRQVSNQNRLNRSSILIHPRGKGSTLKLAAGVQALVRGIEVESDADVAYDTATEHQLRSGMGFTRLVAQWAKDDPFQQVCRIKRVRNPLACYWDPSTQEADFEDMRWMHIIGVIGKDEYEERWGQYGNYQMLTDYLAGDRIEQDWMPEGRVLIAEYYFIEILKRRMLRMHTGENIWADTLEKFRQMYALEHPMEAPAEVLRERMVDKRVVKWAFHNGVDILEGNEDRTDGRELPGTRIPVFPLMGDELDLDGEIDYRGMVRDSRDPQRMYNFWASSIAEAVALAPKAPWIAAKGQIEQYLSDWKDSNRKPKAVLLYDPKAVGDILVPPPQRIVVEPAIQAMVAGLSESDRDLMAVMGLYQPSLGERGSHSESGKARDILREQGNIANSNYLDNLQRHKRAIGRSLLEWIPVVYDVPRVEHLIYPDGKKRPAVIYGGGDNKPAPGEFTDEEGKDLTEMYDVGLGHFDVTVSTGPNAQTEQQATEQWILELFKILPGLAAIGADILLENSPHEAAQQLAKRAKKMLPPQLQDDSDPDQRLPIVESKLAQAQQLLEKAHGAITTMARLLENKQLDNDTKKQVAMISANAQMSIAASKLGNERDIAAFQVEFERYQQLMDQIHAETVIDMNADHQQVSEARQQAGSVQQIREQREADEAVALAQPREPESGSA